MKINKMEILEKLENRNGRKQITPALENKWKDIFDRQAMYRGNGTYSIAGLYSTDTRELFLMFICQQEFNEEFE